MRRLKFDSKLFRIRNELSGSRFHSFRSFGFRA